MNPPVKLIATYGRVSSASQENEGTIATQLSAVSEFAKKNNYSIIQAYSDEGWSGDVLTRPGLDQLRLDAKKKQWQAVLMYDPDRLARRGSWQELIIEELKEIGVDVLFVTVPPPKSDEDIIMYKMRGVFTEYERMKIKERFRLGKVRKVKEGHILVSEALYGYTYILKKENTHGYYVINEEEAKVVRMIFSWVAIDQLGIRAVVTKLHNLGIKPRKSKRGVWSTSSVSNLLRHKGYIGYAHWGSSYAVVPSNPLKEEKYKKIKKSSRIIKPESEWVSSVIPIPPLITEELFNKARAQLRYNFSQCVRNTKNEYLLSGKVWCSCGQRRAGEGPQNGKYLYYRCTDRVKNFPLAPQCKIAGVDAKLVDNIVWKRIAELMSSPYLLEKEIERWIGNRPQHIPTDNTSNLEREIVKYKKQIERYSLAYGDGVYTVKELGRFIQPIKESIKSLELRIHEFRETAISDSYLIPKEVDLTSFSKEVVEMLKNTSFKTRHDITLKLVDRVILDKEKIQVYGFLPITKEDYVKLCPVSRNGLNTIRHRIPFSYIFKFPYPGRLTARF